MKNGNRKYFVVKHGLDAFQALPNYIWRTGWPPPPHKPPQNFPQVVKGSVWVSFAFTDNDDYTRRLSLVTGFYECTETFYHGDIPRKAVDPSGRETTAWMIEGREYGRQPRQPVAVPPLPVLLDKPLFNNQAITPISEKDFKHIRTYVLTHQFDTKKIPFLKREPHNEQELMAAIIVGHQKLGIEKIIRIQTRFPDLLVKLKGHREPVHLEVETYSKSFRLHKHHDQCNRKRQFQGDKKPVAVLCWIDDDPKVKKHVHRVYELQTLLRDNQQIRW